MTTRYITEAQAAEKLQLSEKTLQRYREQKILLRGVHWQRLPGGDIRYIEILIDDWMANLDDPNAHQRAIEIWRSQLLSGKRRRSTPKSQATAPVAHSPSNDAPMSSPNAP